MGTKSWKDFSTLPTHKQEAIRKWFRGAQLTIAVGLLAMLAGAARGEDEKKDKNYIDNLYDDILIFTDYDRIKWTVTPASAFTVTNYVEGFNNLLTQERAQRPGKYLETGEKKWKTNVYKALPSPLIPERNIRMR